MPAACATPMTTGTTIVADAVFDVTSETSAAVTVAKATRPSVLCVGMPPPTLRPTSCAKPGLRCKHAQAQAAAKNQDDSPIDPRRLGPIDGPLPAAIPRQEEQQRRSDQRRHRLRDRILEKSRKVAFSPTSDRQARPARATDPPSQRRRSSVDRCPHVHGPSFRRSATNISRPPAISRSPARTKKPR